MLERAPAPRLQEDEEALHMVAEALMYQVQQPPTTEHVSVTPLENAGKTLPIHQPEVDTAENTEVTGRENMMSPEEVQQVISSNFYTVRCCDRSGMVTFGRTPSGVRSSNMVGTGKAIERSGDRIRMTEDFLGEQGVGEVMSKLPLKEGFTLLTYTTVDHGKHTFRDAFGRPGNRLTYNLVLPDSRVDVDEVWNALRANPALARDMARWMIEMDNKQYITTYREGELYTAQSTGEDLPFPPYEEWQAANGNNKMAFYTAGDTVQTGTIVEFKV